MILTIKLEDREFEPGLKGAFLGGVNKMVDKAHKVKFDDDMTIEIRMIIMNNQTKVITNEQQAE